MQINGNIKAGKEKRDTPTRLKKKNICNTLLPCFRLLHTCAVPVRKRRRIEDNSPWSLPLVGVVVAGGGAGSEETDDVIVILSGTSAFESTAVVAEEEEAEDVNVEDVMSVEEAVTKEDVEPIALESMTV